jgi:APA family basic amino acid/polyamine antiporter
MFGLPKDTWIRLIVWLVIGFIIYFVYSKNHSKLGRGETVAAGMGD